MKPLRLELEGFTAFRNRTVLDLSDLDLFAITGPTGAGKSSLIDAVCYALYGRTPRVNTEMVACISQGLERLQVSLEFQAGANRYRVFRETRRKGAPNVRLEYCLDGDWQPASQGSREVSDRIENILGLTYDGFTRSVLLPQGQFEEFLAGSPDKRRDVLRSLLRLEVYEKMRERASRVAADYRAQIAVHERALEEQFGEATWENLNAKRGELEAKRTESAALAEEAERLVGFTAIASRLDAARAGLESRRSEQTSAVAALEGARADLAGGQVAIETARSCLQEVETLLAANSYDDQLMMALTQAAGMAFELERDAKKLSDAREQMTRAGSLLQEAIAATATAAMRLEAASLEHEAAEAAFEEVRRHNLAAAIQSDLKPGDVCPVCGGRVGVLSPHPAPDLDAARSRFERARTEADSGRQASSAATTARAVAQDRLESSAKLRDDLDTACVQRAQALAEALPGIDDRSYATLKLALEGQKAARGEREDHERRRGSLLAELAGHEQALDAASRDFAVFEDRAANAGAAVASAEKAVAEATTQAGSAIEDAGWQDLGVAMKSGSPIVAAVEARRLNAQLLHQDAFKAVGVLEGAVERIEKDIATAARLKEELKGIKGGLDVAADLSQMLMANRFQAYVQAEALRLLAADGSEKLRQLSAGRYTLAVSQNGQDFEVVDEWNASDRRSVRTLSGGETFLASLALALALAETLPGLAAGRRIALDSVFLDEGFGTLDPESLRLAADALDSLRTEGRMVCVVTHLRELAERLPARIEVTKLETGSTAAIV